MLVQPCSGGLVTALPVARANVPGPAYSVGTTPADRSAPTAPEPNSPSGTWHIFLSPGSGSPQVRFYVEDSTCAALLCQPETEARYDCSRASKAGKRVVFETSAKANAKTATR